MYQESLIRFYFPNSSFERFSWCMSFCFSPTKTLLRPEDLETSSVKDGELQQIIFSHKVRNFDTSHAPGLNFKPMKTPAAPNFAIAPMLSSVTKIVTPCVYVIVLSQGGEALLQLYLWRVYLHSSGTLDPSAGHHTTQN